MAGLEEVARRIAPMAVAVRPEGDAFAAMLLRGDKTILGRACQGDRELLAKLAAEQRFFVEDQGSAAISGGTDADKACERLHRWQTATWGPVVTS